MIDPTHELPIVRQAQLLELSRASVYYLPQPTPESELALMRRIDELHLEHPFAGARMLRDLLRHDGWSVGRKHVATLMRRMGVEARTGKRTPAGATPHIRSIRICCAGGPSIRPTRCGRWIPPTSRCVAVSCT